MPRVQRSPLNVNKVATLAATNPNWLTCDFKRGSVVKHKDKQTGNEIIGMYYNIKDHKNNPLSIYWDEPTYITSAQKKEGFRDQIAFTYGSGSLGAAFQAIILKAEELITSAIQRKELKVSAKRAKITLPVYAETKSGEELDNPLVYITIGTYYNRGRKMLSCAVGESVPTNTGCKFQRFKTINLNNLYEFIRPGMLSTGVIFCDTIKVYGNSISLAFTLKQLALKEEEDELPDFDDLMPTESMQAMAVDRTQPPPNVPSDEKNNNGPQEDQNREDEKEDSFENQLEQLSQLNLDKNN